MNVQDAILRMFQVKRAEEVQAEVQAMAERKMAIQALVEQPGWKVLLERLTPARAEIQRRFEDGEEIRPEDQAFARLVRMLQEGPAQLAEEADTILRDARASLPMNGGLIHGG